MKPVKLYMDSRPGELPEGAYPYGKNGVQHYIKGSRFNEPGFQKMLATMPFAINGIIETDSKPIIFSTNNTDSAIGLYNPDTGLYEPVVNDATATNWPTDEKLGFKIDNYITGESERNYKGELVAAFTDKVTFPKYINCDAPSITRLADLRLFPYYTAAKLTLTEGIGGSLAAGTYYVSTFYERFDGTRSPYSEVSEQLTIAPGEVNSGSDKSITISLTAVDQSYDFVGIAVISKVQGKTIAVELTDLVPVVDGTIDVLYTGDNLTREISIEEILTPPAVYERVGTVGQLNGALYIANLEKEKELTTGIQQYVNMMTVRWKSELINATTPPKEHVAGTVRGLMHEETYALFVRFHKTRGGFTKAFHIPGLPLLPAFTGNSTEATTGGYTTTIPKHKAEDCIPFFDPGTKTGLCGTWLNETEVYPTHDEFNATGVGGPDLRGQAVRHHRMPSLRWCKNNLYAGVPEYGKTSLDLLSIEVVSLNLPDIYDDLIDGYELLYARRTPANMTVYGQAPLLHGVVANSEVGSPTGLATIYTSGGNWETHVNHENKGDYDDNWEFSQLREDTLRMHPFDVLLNRPSIEPTFISAQYKMRRNKLRTEGYLEDGAQDGDRNMPTVHLIDYTIGENTQGVGTGKTLRWIKESFYLNIGISINKFLNVRHESTFAGTLGGTSWPLNNESMGYRLRGNSYTENAMIIDFEETYLVNLLAHKTDIYSPFYSQRLVSAGSYKALNDFSAFKGWDTFVCDYTYHTYGRHDQVDTNGEGFMGKKVIRRIVCESASNIHLRYEIPGNEYSKWYPKEGIAYNNPDQTYITKFDRSKDPNQFGYSKDLNALNDFISSTIFNPFSEEITNFPYRIHRGGKLSRQTKPRAWRTFLPLDYYECQKNMGVIINVTGMYDRLIIHHENAMFLTQDKAQLDAGLLSVTLGTGDIFKFEPQEKRPSKLGYGGTKHDLACIKTPIGYIFPDGDTGELFLWPGGDQLIDLNKDVESFFSEYLKLKENNPYNGNGITIGYDQKYKRILVTVKNDLPETIPTYKVFENTNAFFNALVVGDIVLYDGRLVEYKGLNVPLESGFDCEADPDPSPTYAWEPIEWICEQDEIVTEIPLPTPEAFDNMSSPGALLYDNAASKMHVADYDNAGGNFYRIDTTTGAKTYFGGATTLYSIVKDRDNKKIFASALSGGLQVFNTAAESVTAVSYGTNTALSRVGLWIIGDNVVARDITTNTLTLIHRTFLTVLDTINIAVDIPSGSTYLSGNFQLLQVDSTVWVIPDRRTGGNIAVYSQDFSVLITTITLADALAVPDWGADLFWQTAYYDATTGHVYINEVGSSLLLVLDAGTYTIISSYAWAKGVNVHSVLITYLIDPATGSLYLVYKGVENDGLTVADQRVYVVNRTTGEFEKVYMGATIEGELERIGAGEYMWVAVPGNRSWEGGSWSTDGQIKQYAHGQTP